jgi:hypothetical protein
MTVFERVIADSSALDDVDVGSLAECIELCQRCVASCTACADECLGHADIPRTLWPTIPHSPYRVRFSSLGALCLLAAACGGESASERGDDAGTERSDSAVQFEDFDGDGEPDLRSTVIEAPVDVQRALCSNDYQTAALSYDKITRGSWQFNPGGGFVELGEAGYPCRAFLHDGMRPTPTDARWTDATDRDFVGFSEVSTITAPGYNSAQFRYFRTLIFVPAGKRPSALTVHAAGIDDSLYLAIYNSTHPKGVSPVDVGPSELEVGACAGNGQATWNVTNYIEPGEINMLLLVHADMNPATSALASVEVEADGLAIQMVSCGVP